MDPIRVKFIKVVFEEIFFSIGIAQVDSRERNLSQNVENPQSGVCENNAHLFFSLLRRRPPFPPEYNVGSRGRRARHRSFCASKNERLFRKADNVFSSPNIGCGGRGGKLVTIILSEEAVMEG